MKLKIPDYLNRYTSLPYLLDALRMKRLLLRSPELWEDKNDSFYLRRYQEEMKFETLLALCFNVTREQFHHWKCFADRRIRTSAVGRSTIEKSTRSKRPRRRSTSGRS